MGTDNPSPKKGDNPPPEHIVSLYSTLSLLAHHAQVIRWQSFSTYLVFNSIAFLGWSVLVRAFIQASEPSPIGFASALMPFLGLSISAYYVFYARAQTNSGSLLRREVCKIEEHLGEVRAWRKRDEEIEEHKTRRISFWFSTRNYIYITCVLFFLVHLYFLGVSLSLMLGS